MTKSKTRVAINGFGRIGRCTFRAWLDGHYPDIDIVAINDLADSETAAFLLEFDSVHGRLGHSAVISDDAMQVAGKTIIMTAMRDPALLPWKKLDIDLVMECSGVFTSADKAKAHIDAGAKRVLVSAPSTGADKTIVYGINHQTITAKDVIISNASCTTNCLAPIADTLNKVCGIEQGFMTTIHSYTGDQPTLDTDHSDLYRARAAALNMIPTSTGAARAVGLVLPELAGKLDGVAVRVPTPNVSAVDLTFMPQKTVSADDINAAFINAERTHLNGVLATTDKKLVSGDMNHHSASSIAHLDQTRVMTDGMTRVFAWYDNEWGFSNRMLDVARAIRQAA